MYGSVRSLIRSLDSLAFASFTFSLARFCREMLDKLPGLQTVTDRGLRRYSPPPARSPHPVVPCLHLSLVPSFITRSLVLLCGRLARHGRVALPGVAC
jgi:hypothetical protein